MIMMIRLVLTTLVVNMAAIFASERHDNYITLLRGAGGGNNIPGLIGAQQQLVDVRSDHQISAPGACTYYSAASDTCPTGYYCFIDTGLCWEMQAEPGLCISMSSSYCIGDYYAPQCGCDGKTYSNACMAASAGANIAYDGECNTET